jgi:predicted HD superfamily hydrolase involved in NAD metabolism
MSTLRAMENRVRGLINEKRYLHTLGVRDTALLLCRQYGCSRKKAEVAALLHDIARDLPVEKMVELIQTNGLWKGEYSVIEHNPLLLHAHAGRVIALTEFNVHDVEILQSIELHTTGGESMSLLDKIIFVADFTEPGRTFRGVEKARELARMDLDRAVLYIYSYILRHLLKREVFICKNTFLGYNEIVLQVGKGLNQRITRDRWVSKQ